MSVSNAAPSVVSQAEATTKLNRTNLILLVVLLAQLALTAVVFWPRTSPTTGNNPILPGVSASEATALTITDESDRSVSFVKEDDLWTLADSDGYPANTDKITETLDKLSAITADRLVTRTPGSHDRLQVAEDNYLRKVDITTPDGEQTLYLGSSAGASTTHVRAAGHDETYLTNEVATWELDTLASTWIDVAYMRIPKEDITEVTLENANGTFTFVRGQEEANAEGTTEWTLADATAEEPIASANISTLIDRIANLNLHSVLGKSEAPEYGLSEPLATLTITISDTATGTVGVESGTTTLLIGAKDGETNAYYAKSSGSEFYVRIAAFTGDEFVEKDRSGFMIQQSNESADAASSQTEPAAAESDPSVDATGVITETGELDEGASEEATEEVTDEATVEPDIEASEVVTDSVEATEDAAGEEADDEEAEDEEAVDESTPTATPEPASTPTS